MPLQCPHCQIAQAEGNETCINCGRPLTLTRAVPAAPLLDPALIVEADAAAHPAEHATPLPADPVHAVPSRRDSWRLPALIAVGLLLAFVAASLWVAQRKSARPAALSAPTQMSAAVPPVATDAPAPPATPAMPTMNPKTTLTTPAALPLTITLASTSEGKHVKVGDPVTLTAFTALAHGQSATMTLFYRRGRGEKTMFSFVQGSLCSTTWTAPVPGRYEFTASALGDRRQAAVSRRIEITVDQPVPLTAALKTAPAVAAPSPPPAAAPVAKTTAHAARPAPALTYHVAAAEFSFPRSAEVLSDALNQRGYQATPERMADSHGKTVYVVVTGAYRRPSEARKAALDLQRSGYPAYFFGSR